VKLATIFKTVILSIPFIWITSCKQRQDSSKVSAIKSNLATYKLSSDEKTLTRIDSKTGEEVSTDYDRFEDILEATLQPIYEYSHDKIIELQAKASRLKTLKNDTQLDVENLGIEIGSLNIDLHAVSSSNPFHQQIQNKIETLTQKISTKNVSITDIKSKLAEIEEENKKLLKTPNNYPTFNPTHLREVLKISLKVTLEDQDIIRNIDAQKFDTIFDASTATYQAEITGAHFDGIEKVLVFPAMPRLGDPGFYGALLSNGKITIGGVLKTAEKVSYREKLRLAYHPAPGQCAIGFESVGEELWSVPFMKNAERLKIMTSAARDWAPSKNEDYINYIGAVSSSNNWEIICNKTGLGLTEALKKAVAPQPLVR